MEPALNMNPCAALSCKKNAKDERDAFYAEKAMYP